MSSSPAATSETKHSSAGDENQQLLFNHINEQIVKNARVVEENERLETELQQRAESVAPSTTREDASATATGASEEQHQQQLSRKYDDLKRKYQDLSQKVKYLERKNNAVMQKNRDMKDSVRAWQQYADRQKPQQKMKGATGAEERARNTSPTNRSDDVPPDMPSSPRSVNTVRTLLQRADRGYSSPTVDVSLEAHDAAVPPEDEEQFPDGSVTPKGPTVTRSNMDQGAVYGDRSSATGLDRMAKTCIETNTAPSSSQTTIDEAVDQFHRHTQTVDGIGEDDLPLIVSERSLKRKRGQQSKIDVYTGRSSDGTPAKPHRVKDEPLSSPTSALRVLTRTETIDLDDPGANPLQRTPSIYSHSHSTNTSRHQRSGSAPFSQTTKGQGVQKEQRARDRASDAHSRLHFATEETRALSEPMDPRFNNQFALQPLDLNIIAQTVEQTPNKRLKQSKARLMEYNTLAESCDAPPPMDENELRLPPSAARARLQKMRALKDPETPTNHTQRQSLPASSLVQQEQISSSPAGTPRLVYAPSGSTETKKSALGARTSQYDDIVPDGRPVWSMRIPNKQLDAPKRSLPTSDKHSSLRNTPVKELRVQDFKPNPVYNHGYSYAFTEAVRKRGDRMCLPGCTNTQCCGSHFRRLAEALDVLPATQEEALLEEYLGDAYNTVMSTQVSSDERAELVLQARTKKMARDSGKHREAHERRKTPPGFWRVDFPSTQEQESDRERAKEQEVKTVQERWLEAHKKGGRWIFRDE